MAIDFNYILSIKKMLVSVKYDFFYCLELIEINSYSSICPLLSPKVSAKKIHYYGKILEETGKLILLI